MYLSFLMRGGIVITVLLFTGFFTHAQSTKYPAIDPQSVTIVRDSFGIPHIYAKTDAEVAYGLAWANAEDAFHETQNLMYIAKGFTGRAQGVEGAKADFFAHAIGARKLVEERYEKDLSPEFRKYLDGFCQGLNAYAAAYPEKVKVKQAFPIEGKDVVAAYVVTLSFMTGADEPLSKALAGKFDSKNVYTPPVSPSNQLGPVGSNAFAFNSTKTIDGKTYLCINPHLYMDGALSFYEAHLQSEEGLNIQGAMFQGSTSVIMGTNQHLGWGMTWNHFDKLDVFKLEMHPKKKLQYKMDGVYKTLEKRPVWLKVNLSKKGKFVLPVKKMAYWSEYGMTIKSEKESSFYAVRFPANMTVKSSEQLYRMNKATNFDVFKEALNIHAIPLFNIVYADKDDNIHYTSYGMMPDRNPAYLWSQIVPGNTSKTLWTQLVPVTQMPQVSNPECGYVFNTNNSPFIATAGECNDDSCRLPEYAAERNGDNNRSTRFKEWIEENDKVTFEGMKQIKFDVSISKQTNFYRSLLPLFRLDEQKYPDLAGPLRIIKAWNLEATIEQTAPTLVAFCIDKAFKKTKCGDECFVFGFTISEEQYAQFLRDAVDTLTHYYGTYEVPWGNINQLQRGNVAKPLAGFPDALTPCYPKTIPGTGKLHQKYGDTYTMLVRYGRNGLEHAEAIQPLGNSINPESRHYNSQIEPFVNRQLRTVDLSIPNTLKRAEAVCHPVK